MDDLKEFSSSTSYAKYRYIDGVLHVILAKELIIDLKVAKAIEKQRLVLCAGEKYPTLIVVPENFLLFDDDALEYFATSGEGCIAKAMVFQGTLRKLLTNFKFTFKQMNVPFRVFNSKVNARLWLFEFVKEDLLNRDDWL
ncbi:MAG: hypothetical protein HRT74_07590 [Flavobacteriales bacterium]|nr:hypothetical protein [Flavobacteriales bacterium]